LGEFQPELFCGGAVAPWSLACRGRDLHTDGVWQKGLANHALSGASYSWRGVTSITIISSIM